MRVNKKMSALTLISLGLRIQGQEIGGGLCISKASDRPACVPLI